MRVLGCGCAAVLMHALGYGCANIVNRKRKREDYYAREGLLSFYSLIGRDGVLLAQEIFEEIEG